MKKSTRNIIGVMSGTSLDGVDIAYLKFEYNNTFLFEIIHTETIPYTDKWRNRLDNAFTATAEEITQLHVDYGIFLGKLILDFTNKHQINKVDLVASHGHTIFHNPQKGYTLQIGDGATIATTCQQKVISDFRTQDVAMGGQGAPLVPIGDQILFNEYNYCVNIGGFANISFDDKGIRKAFDVCPANIVLNHYTRKIGLEFDDKGKIAKTGKLHNDLLKALDSLAIYHDKKSMGNEIVVSEFIPLIDSFNLPIEDLLHTYIEHFSNKIGKELKPNTTSLITGGGAFNDYLIKRIKYYTKSKIVIPERKLINYKEALIFGFLGLLRDENEVNCLASVTGATKNHSSGVIHIP